MGLAIGLARLVEVELDPGAPPALAIAPSAMVTIDESPGPTSTSTSGPTVGPPEPLPVSAVTDGPRTYVVKAGETLGVISKKVYGTTRHWKQLHEANRDVIPDPARMRAGTKIKLPRINGR